MAQPRGSTPVDAAPEDSAPVESWLAEWGRSLDDAADAWQPELTSLLDHLSPLGGSAVLDAGCGSGRITGWIAERVGPRGSVCALDREEDALRLTHAALRGDPTRHVEGWLGSLEHLPFDDDTFGATWCSSVLGYLADPGQGLRELVRVTRPGGRILALTGDAARAMFLPIDPALETRLHLAEHRAMRAGAWGSPIDIHLGRRLYSLACDLPVASIEPMSVVWERTAPLLPVERAYLTSVLAWLTDPASRRWLRRDWDACRDLFHPDSDRCLIDRDDLHVVQTATAVVITV